MAESLTLVDRLSVLYVVGSSAKATASAPQPALRYVEAASAPCLLDYLFLFLGVGISALLAKMAGLQMLLPTDPTPGLQAVRDVLPTLLFLPVGVILFWPIFYTTQWLRGRRDGLSVGEWLMGLAWLGALAFTAWCIGKGTETLPGFFTEDDFKKYAVLGYILFMLSMGTLALVIWLIGLVGRWQQPWTHTLSLALLLWPALPLLVVWLGNLKME